MVDMLCCALGCVILVWLLNAKFQEDNLQEQAQANATLLEQARAERERNQTLLSSLQADRDKTARELATARTDGEGVYALLMDLDRQLRTLEESRAALRRQLAAQQTRARDLESQLKTTRGTIAALEAEARTRTARMDIEKARSDGLGRKLADSETALKTLRRELSTAQSRYRAVEESARALEKKLSAGEREASLLGRKIEDLEVTRKTLERTLAARTRELADRQKLLAEADLTAQMLRGEKKQLEAEVRRVRTASENRFAGIELTGRRVIFLVDMSGSMEMVDENTRAPNKWVEVRNTVRSVMRSLPDLEKFQVILFNSSTSYLLGSKDRWIPYDSKTSADQVFKALTAVKPKGGTNMYIALEAAFRFRPQGLDTVYLLSDGLPNQGEGLTPAQSRKMNEIQRGFALGKYIRKKLATTWNRSVRMKDRVRIHTIGFFYESPDLGAFLWALARENDGSFVGMSRP
jgi:hypothetical protein